MDGIVFTIDGQEYLFTGAQSLTMDEAIIVYEYSGLTLDQVDEVDGFHPGVAASFVHIAIARAEPTMKKSAIRKRVGAIPLEDVGRAFAEAEEKAADAGPPDVAPPTEPESPRSGGATEESSGPSSRNDGEDSPEPAPPTPSGTPA